MVGPHPHSVRQSHTFRLPSAPPALHPRAAASAPCEAFCLRDNVLGFQFHPELPLSLAYSKIWSSLSANGTLGPAEAKESEEALLSSEVRRGVGWGAWGGGGRGEGQGRRAGGARGGAGGEGGRQGGR